MTTVTFPDCRCKCFFFFPERAIKFAKGNLEQLLLLLQSSWTWSPGQLSRTMASLRAPNGAEGLSGSCSFPAADAVSPHLDLI